MMLRSQPENLDMAKGRDNVHMKNEVKIEFVTTDASKLPLATPYSDSTLMSEDRRSSQSR